jgi:rod shape-determining protein MreC
MSQSGNPAAERLRTAITDTLIPVLEVAARPIDAIAGAGAWLTEMARLHAENIALKNQNLQLLKWQAVAKDMEAENQSLRALLKVVPSQSHSFVTARIVSDLGGPYVHSALINGGSQSGIKKNQAVMNENGLVGRVVEVGETSARVLLLSDINSRVPVIAESVHEKSILSGNNEAEPTLSYLAAGSKIAVGERIVTSGDGGIFPAGIPVGVVTSIENNVVRVQPFADPARIEYISAVDYSF